MGGTPLFFHVRRPNPACTAYLGSVQFSISGTANGAKGSGMTDGRVHQWAAERGTPLTTSGLRLRDSTGPAPAWRFRSSANHIRALPPILERME